VAKANGVRKCNGEEMAAKASLAAASMAWRQQPKAAMAKKSKWRKWLMALAMWRNQRQLNNIGSENRHVAKMMKAAEMALGVVAKMNQCRGVMASA